MTIDIISYTEAQLSALTEEQIERVEMAQLDKNKLDAQLEKDKAAEKARLLERGIFLSPIWELYCEQLQKTHDLQVETVRAALLFYLQYTQKATDEETSAAPYAVNYALPMTERLTIVRTYYDTTYSDAQEKFDAFKADTVAPNYLGEYYGPLYDTYREAIG